MSYYLVFDFDVVVSNSQRYAFSEKISLFRGRNKYYRNYKWYRGYMIFAIMLKKSLLYYLLITSLPDTAGGEGNPTVKRHHALLPEDTHRCFASGYDVGLFTCVSLSFIFYLSSRHLPQLSRSSERYVIASEICSGEISSAPSRSAIVRATLIMRS